MYIVLHTYFIYFWLLMYSLRNVMLGCITQPLNYSTGSRDNILKYGSSTTHIQVNIPRRNVVLIDHIPKTFHLYFSNIFNNSYITLLCSILLHLLYYLFKKKKQFSYECSYFNIIRISQNDDKKLFVDNISTF